MAPKNPPVYRKLTGIHRGVGLLSQLWLGADHLLNVTSTGYTESYRRFYLRDIQAMMIVHTGRRTYIACALLLLCLLGVFIVIAADGGWPAAGVVALCFLPFFLWNQLRGPGCRVIIISAVQQENIPALSRLPKTRRVLAELKPRIEQAQAGLGGAPAPLAGPPPIGANVPPPLPLA